MLRSWTMAGQIEMIAELKQIVHQAEALASQQRAVRGTGPARDIHRLLDDSRATLARLETALAAGARPSDTRRELSAFYRIVVRETARADALRHGDTR